MVFHWIRDLQSVLYKDIVRRNKQTPFIVTVSFLLAFAAARLTVLFGPDWLRLFISQYHIHHFYYGFALIAISNWIALTTDRRHMINFAAVLFGIGLGLFVDEFGLLLTCTTPPFECNYYSRTTYDIFTYIVAGFFTILFSGPMISVIRRIIHRIF